MRAVPLALALLAFIAFDSTLAARADDRPSPSAAAANPSQGSSGGGAQRTSSTPMAFANGLKVVFVVALGDPATSAKIAVALASELRRNPNRTVPKSASAPPGAFHLRSDSTAVVPEGGWGLNDYVEQCRTYPDSTQGAFIVLPPSTGTDTENFLVVVRDNATIAFNALIADCESDHGVTPQGTPKILWASDTATGRYGRSTLQFLPFAVLTSVYLAFSPQRTYQTTSTTVFPTPNPLPAHGARSSVQTVSSSVLNASGTGSLQTNVVSSVAGAQLAFGRHGGPDHLTMHAAEDAVGKLLLLLSDECPRIARRQGPDIPSASSAPAVPAPAAFCEW